MRSAFGYDLLRTASRFAMVAVIGSVAAACSSETVRFNDSPFSNPFSTADSGADPVRTGSIDGPAPTRRAAPVRSEPLAPVSSASTSRPAPTPAAPRTANAGSGWSTNGGTAVTVAGGDTLSSIASRYGVPPAAILSANGLTASQVVPGRRVVIPIYSASGEGAAPSTGRVVSSAPIDVKRPVPSTVAEAATRRRPGQPTVRQAEAPAHEVAPKPAPKVAAAKPAPKVAAAKPAPKAAPKTEPKAVRVARAEPVKPETKKPEPVKPVPAAKPQPQAKAETKPEPKPVRTARAAEPAPKPAPVVTAAQEPAKPPVAVKEPESTGSVGTQPTDPQPGFRWPARGRVIAGFGGGSSNEGINIAVPDGTPVKAAGDGVVAYAGSEVKGYGNLVLIRHENGFVSAYAHNGDVDVKRGQRVTRGQTIARSGQTGNVTSPQLHFEIRKGSTPVDPMRFLAAAN